MPRLRHGSRSASAGCGDEAGWNLQFGRELNASDDRSLLQRVRRTGLPVIEGKHIAPFALDTAGVTRSHRPALVEHAIGRRPFEHPRLAYRDVASSTNRLTLIAAILPAGVITTHTLFCLRDPPADEDVQHFIAGIFNSFVANFMVRLRVTTHVTVAIVERLPVPRPARRSAAVCRYRDAGAAAAADPADRASMARLQAAAAKLYELDAAFVRTRALDVPIDRARAPRGVHERHLSVRYSHASCPITASRSTCASASAVTRARSRARPSTRFLSA